MGDVKHEICVRHIIPSATTTREPERIFNIPAAAANLLLPLLLPLPKAASPPPGITAPSSPMVPLRLPTVGQVLPLLEKEARFCRAWSAGTSSLAGLLSISSSLRLAPAFAPAPGDDGGGGDLTTAKPDVLCASGGDAGDNERGGGGAAPEGPGLRRPADTVTVGVDVDNDAAATASAATVATPAPGEGGRRDAAATGEKSDRATGLGERRGTPPPAGNLDAHRIGEGGSCQAAGRSAATRDDRVCITTYNAPEYTMHGDTRGGVGGRTRSRTTTVV